MVDIPRNIPRNNKRIRLVEAADRLFHEKGVAETTLAKIADLAGVPLGNVYYYFKSKDSIILAVSDYRRTLLQQEFEELESTGEHLERLVNLVKRIIARREQLAIHGDALGSLCHELGKQSQGPIADSASQLMRSILEWVEAQFKAAGKTANAQVLARHFVASLQGLSLMTLALKDVEFTEQQGHYLLDWLATV